MPDVINAPMLSSLPTGDTGVFACLYGQLFPDGPQNAEIESIEELASLLNSKKNENITAEFERLVAEWKANRPATSLSRDLVTPAYLRIIGMGPRALPLILRQLEMELDHWFVALKAVSGEDPVPAQSRGKMQEMANAWLKWGREKGYVW
jgi:hypothetical protein